MKIEVWYLTKTHEEDTDGMIRLFIRGISTVIDPKFIKWERGQEVYDYNLLDSWQHLKPEKFVDGYTESDGNTYNYLGEL